MWSYVEDRCLAMGYVNHGDGVSKEWLESGSFEIEVALQPIPATPSIRSFYDPMNRRVRL
jgi:glycine cleavage system aminomethyltransferase T